MKPHYQLTLWLVLAADAMFLIGLLGASRVVPRNVPPIAKTNALIVACLLAGRITLMVKPRSLIRLFLALSAIFCAVVELIRLHQMRAQPDILTLLQWTFFIHLAVLAAATFALAEELTLLWNFVLALGLILLLASR